MKELKEELKKVMKTGKIEIGSKKVIKALLTADPKLIIVSQTCPRETIEKIKYYCTLGEVPLAILDKSSLELGAAGGKPFPISALGIMKEGGGKILDLRKK